jgi:hypothetical protein
MSLRLFPVKSVSAGRRQKGAGEPRSSQCA